MTLFDTLDTNAILVLRTAWLHPNISRTDIARIIGIDQSTVSRIVSNLMEQGLIEVVSEGPSSKQGGRRPVFLRINPLFGGVVGIELQNESYSIIGMDLLGTVCFAFSDYYEHPSNDYVQLFVAAYQKALRFMKDRRLTVLGVGVGVPGIVDSEKGIILRSNPLSIETPLPFVELASQHVDVPIRIEHDARCGCWAELVFNRGRCPKNFLYILGEFRRRQLQNPDFQGLALGLGLVMGGKVYTGENFAAGEFRSVFFRDTNRNQILGMDDSELDRLESSPEVQANFARELGVNLALLVNVLNITKVFIGGNIDRLGDRLVGILREEICRNWTYDRQNTIEIEYSKVGIQSVAYGASAMLLERMFTPRTGSPSTHELLERLEDMRHSN